MLNRAEPPMCVGLYARWGSGKTFMISLLKKEFDPTVREDPHTHQLLQFFEQGYEKQDPADDSKPESVGFLIYGLLFNILLFFIPTVPYWASTILSILRDALNFREELRGVCSRLKRSYMCKAAVVRDVEEKLLEEFNKSQKEKTNEMLEVDSPQKDSKQIQKEFVFVHFNAWECACCVHLYSIGSQAR